MRSTYNQTQNGTNNQKNFAEYTGAVETFRGTDFTITTETLHLPPSYRILLLPTRLGSFRFGLRSLRHQLDNFLSRLLSNLDIIIYGGPLILLGLASCRLLLTTEMLATFRFFLTSVL